MLQSKMTSSFSSFFILEKQSVKAFPSAAQLNFLWYIVKVHADSRKGNVVVNCRINCRIVPA